MLPWKLRRCVRIYLQPVRLPTPSRRATLAIQGCASDEEEDTVTAHPAGDIVVVGAGNAALSAALAAHEQGASVIVIEKAPHAWRGGNTRFTGGVYRSAYAGTEDAAAIVSEPLPAGVEAGYYAPGQFYDDLMA